MLETHRWIVAPYRQDRLAALCEIPATDAPLLEIDCHRQRRGPYTGAGELLRILVPQAYQKWPELVLAHAREILSLAPELQTTIPAPPATLTTLAIPKERTRFYGRVYTRRLAHGIVNFLLEIRAASGQPLGPFFFDNVQAADYTDQELLSILLRRVQPQHGSIALGSTTHVLTDPLQQALTRFACQIQPQPPARREQEAEALPPAWQAWLEHAGQGWRGEREALQEITLWPQCGIAVDTPWAQGLAWLVAHLEQEQRLRLGRAYVESEGTSAHPLEQLAYQQSAESVRQQWHDERAETLAQLGQWSLQLGALPYHREQGSQAATLGVESLLQAINYCVDMGFYDWTQGLGERGRRLVTWETQPLRAWVFTSKLAIALAMFEQADEAEALISEARGNSSDPQVHIQAAYMTAMNYTRHRGPRQRNHQQARAWINVARAIAQGSADPQDRAFQVAFQDNGMALVELHLGRPTKALELVEGAISQLDQELTQDQHRLHRSVLLYNRGQVYAYLKQWEKALVDYTAVIALDPHFSEYYLDRGNLYRQLKQYERALQDYQQALQLSSPYPELYFNRALLLADMGQVEAALADYTTILELEPDYLDALVNRASLLYEQGDFQLARRDIAHGLQLQAGHAQLLCLLGLLELGEEHPALAYQALSAAIEQDPLLVAAWTNRAVLAFEQGQVEAAIEDLSRACALGENAAVRYNRGIAYQALQQWERAIEDFSAALDLDREDEQDLLYRRGCCLARLGNAERAHQDFQAHLALGPSPYGEELRQVDPSLIR
ncbi:MAG TPA: tetratricopeptide repeat protein [Ktedonobacteraceae bacterium]|jgi:tetratricopeptide (TPR) repeat protein